jgi:hypothetical protein
MSENTKDAINQALDDWMYSNKKQYVDENVFNSAFAENVYNGKPIDWVYWEELSNITPQQAARLKHHIDPIKYPSGEYHQGKIPPELIYDINRLTQWLECRAQLWTLEALVDAIGEDKLPVGMVQALKNAATHKLASNSKANELNWDDWLSREQITLDDCLLLAMGENPQNPDINTDWWDGLSGDDYRERQAEAEKWIKRKELKARKENNNGSVEYKNINPLTFFNFARSNDWDLPEPLHDWLENQDKLKCVTWQGEIQPLESLTNEQKQNYNNQAAWTWVDAIYILQGYKPVFQLNTEQVRSHFPDWVKYFTDSLFLGTVGKETIQAGERIFIDSPANWQAFWQKAKHDNLQEPVETLGSDIKKHDISENKEFARVIVQWLFDLWIEKGTPETKVFKVDPEIRTAV